MSLLGFYGELKWMHIPEMFRYHHTENGNIGELIVTTRAELTKKHGTPPEFASAVYRAVPEFLSMDEAREAVDRYSKEWFECEDAAPNALAQGPGGSSPGPAGAMGSAEKLTEEERWQQKT